MSSQTPTPHHELVGAPGWCFTLEPSAATPAGYVLDVTETTGLHGTRYTIRETGTPSETLPTRTAAQTTFQTRLETAAAERLTRASAATGPTLAALLNEHEAIRHRLAHAAAADTLFDRIARRTA